MFHLSLAIKLSKNTSSPNLSLAPLKLNVLKKKTLKKTDVVGLTRLHKWGGAHQTFINTQITSESLVRVEGRGEVGITGYQPNIDAWYTSLI